MEPTREDLESFGIYQLRTIGREIGVKLPTTYNKQELISEIMDIVDGKKEPYFKQTKRGRPPKDIKQEEPALSSKQKLSQMIHLSREEVFYLNDPTRELAESEVDVEGLLLSYNDYYVIVPRIWSGKFCYVTKSTVSINDLAVGDFVVGKAKQKSSFDKYVLTSVQYINGVAPASNGAKKCERTENLLDNPLMNEAENLFMHTICPIKAGDRVLATADDKKSLIVGVYSLVKNLVANPDNRVVCVLSNSTYDYISVFEAIEGLTLIATAFDVEDTCQLGQYELALKHIKRLTEVSDKNIVEVIVDVGAIMSIYNHTQDANATLYEVKTNFSNAKNSDNSLTIIYGMVYNNSVYEELDGAESVKVALPTASMSRRFRYKFDILHTERSGLFDERSALATAICAYIGSGDYEERHLALEGLIDPCTTAQELIDKF